MVPDRTGTEANLDNQLPEDLPVARIAAESTTGLPPPSSAGSVLNLVGGRTTEPTAGLPPPSSAGSVPNLVGRLPLPSNCKLHAAVPAYKKTKLHQDAPVQDRRRWNKLLCRVGSPASTPCTQQNAEHTQRPQLQPHAIRTINKAFSFIELFAGSGGLSRALRDVPFVFVSTPRDEWDVSDRSGEPSRACK